MNTATALPSHKAESRAGTARAVDKNQRKKKMCFLAINKKFKKIMSRFGSGFQLSSAGKGIVIATVLP